ncbi:hypothetical protein P152DRAFT_144387 [Eremomyces bilateralis CBS 781.70]|uniref:Kinetochore protein Sos7 coiled-coil domain-containing protein n=1 Tax=Eremomyces bilateralis CBS 781.70 TaxID=1392243 RepID=A0A6G1FVV1_9PEZI|nr:uncharacterized protein P152DRAFT_144387 [Eremomyces bilateralis CBS 781.70]KAF1809957.1 hypothetical protein P152DRAFT_144387 [Eremomyces bilateralis CBS 781.70]
MDPSVQETLDKLLETQRSHQLALLRLAESIRGDDASTGEKRDSDVSADPYENGTPASLQAELEHYKELFSKLKFSYIEQVTKEKFLRAITAENPVYVEQQENLELEAKLAQDKSALKSQKLEVERIVAEIDRKARATTQQYETLAEQQTQLESLPIQNTALAEQIEELRERLPHSSDEPHLSLPLSQTLDLAAARDEELADLDAQITSLQMQEPKKARELERLRAELGPLEAQKMKSVTAAKEARRRKEEGGIDDLEVKGRWYRAVDATLRGMLEVDG